MTTVASAGTLERYAHRLTKVDAIDVPRDVAGQRVADTVAAFVAGRTTDDGRRLAGMLQHRTLTPADAAIFAAMVRHTEIDDIHLATCVTASAIVVSAALAEAARSAVDGHTLVRGLVAGYDAALRFGRALGGAAALREGIWPTLAVAPVVAAAVAGVMRGLPAEALACALQLASMRSILRPGRGGYRTARWYLFGTSVAAGLDACNAAAAGFVADLAAPSPLSLEEDAANEPVDASAIATIAQKPICTARQSLSGTWAFLELIDSGIDVASIEHVRVAVPATYGWMIAGASAADRMSMIVSQPFGIAAAALDRGRLYDIDRIAPPSAELLAFAARVSVENSVEFDAVYPERWPARVNLELADGSRRTHTVESPLGDPGRPLSFDDLKRKSPSYSGELHEAALAATSAGPAGLLRLLSTTR